MADFRLGSLIGVPAKERPDLAAEPVRRALESLDLWDAIGVVEVDDALSDTAATRDAYGLVDAELANCVVVAGAREGVERIAACVVLADSRADVNAVVRRRLDVRKASFLPMDRAVAESGMAYGGITPIGLPRDWPLLIDARVAAADLVVIGSGIRPSKLLAPGAVLAALPGAEVVDGLGKVIVAG